MDSNIKTYSAVCDMCAYKATTQANDQDSAADKLAKELADHNHAVHSEPSKVEDIVEAVKGKMITESTE